MTDTDGTKCYDAYDEQPLSVLAPGPWTYDEIAFELTDSPGRLVCRLAKPPVRWDADVVARGLIAICQDGGMDVERFDLFQAMSKVAPRPWREDFGGAVDRNGAKLFSILSTRGDADLEYPILRKIIGRVNLLGILRQAEWPPRTAPRSEFQGFS